MNIKIEITEEQLWRIQLSLQQSIVSAERTLEEFAPAHLPHKECKIAIGLFMYK